MLIPAHLAANCRKTREGTAWLEALPNVVQELTARWSLEVEAPYDSLDVTASWVAPVGLPDGAPAVLKVGLPHMEAHHEADGLRFWDGDPTVYLLDGDSGLNALLLERCTPGTPLRNETDDQQDVVIASLLRRLWQRTSPGHPFRPLSTMLSVWSDETRAQEDAWPDATLVGEGLDLFEELAQGGQERVLLATDLHAGNVLRAEREPWLVIDPKPFVGDPAYDVTQHLFNCLPRMLTDPHETIRRFASLLD
ncbi:MAG: aminoglycoside phosphotransferase family protein, partial [Gemmatimonadetes bacterium]|nr:aminoglycoside phosphotransferase family protein [Gemmatimonadota bacterium]